MKLRDFKTEQWMNEHEGNAVYNLTDTCIAPLTYKELIELDDAHLLDKVVLDYGEIPGSSSFRHEVLKLYEHGTIDQILLMPGCLEANEQIMLCLLECGDNVIVFTPGYQQFMDIPESIGCHVIEIPLHEENQWLPDMADIRRAMQQDIKMVILNNPSNPTGTLFEGTMLQEIIALAEKQKTWILSDEVYRGLNPQEKSISDLYEYGISTSSLSKIFSLAGLRLGWVKGNAEVIHQLAVRRDYSVISTGPLTDALGTIALSHRDYLLQRNRKIVETNKQVVCQWLKDEKRCSLVMPAAGTVGFLKYNVPIPSAELAAEIEDKYGIFFVPGSCFDCEFHLRLGFTNQPEKTKKGLLLLSRYLDERIVLETRSE